MTKRKKKKQKVRELTEQNIIDIDARREEKRRRLRAEADASRAKRGEKSITQEMLDEISYGDRPAEEPPERRPVPKKKKRSGSVHVKICIAVAAVVLVALIFSIGKIIGLQLQKSEAERKLEELTAEKAELEKQVEQIGTPEYMEKQAREWLRMAKQGEIIYITDGDDNEKDG